MITNRPPAGMGPNLHDDPGTLVTPGERKWRCGVTAHVVIVGMAKTGCSHLDQ